MKSTHKSIGHFEGGEERSKWIRDGTLCGETGLYSSADWIAVDCKNCLKLRDKDKKCISN